MRVDRDARSSRPAPPPQVRSNFLRFRVAIEEKWPKFWIGTPTWKLFPPPFWEILDPPLYYTGQVDATLSIEAERLFLSSFIWTVKELLI